MDIQTRENLTQKKCVPCEGGVDVCPLPFVTEQLKNLPGWYLVADNQRIRKDWTFNNFLEGIAFFNQVAQVAEDEAHHPDLHLESYRNVSIVIWTHAISGLSENDFILAAKIDQIAPR